MKKVASLKYGVVFKKAFCDPEIFSAFVRDVIGIDIEVDHVETEKEFDPPVGYIKPRFDLFAEDKKHRIVVDIQHARTSDHYDRFLYYHCAALLEQIQSASNYRPPLKVFTLVVLTSGDRHQKDVSVTDFDPHDLAGNPLGEIPHKVIYLCPKYVSENTPKPYREWLQAIDDTLDEEVDENHYHHQMIQRLFEAILRQHISPEERARMIDEYHQEELQQQKFERGVAEGLVKGQQQEKKRIARILLAQDMAPILVAEATGLALDEIEKLTEL